jgi:hypothetical protein
MTRQLQFLNRLKQPRVDPRKALTRRWVETADERCPLACVWFALREPFDTQDDEPGTPWPAFCRFLRKAGRLHNIHLLWAPLTPIR